MRIYKEILLDLAKKHNVSPIDLLHLGILTNPRIRLLPLKEFLKIEKANSLNYLQTITKVFRITGIPKGKYIIDMAKQGTDAGKFLTKIDLARAVIIFEERAEHEDLPELRERYKKLADLFRELYQIVKAVENDLITLEEADRLIEEWIKKAKELNDPILNEFLSKIETEKVRIGELEIEI